MELEDDVQLRNPVVPSGAEGVANAIQCIAVYPNTGIGNSYHAQRLRTLLTPILLLAGLNEKRPTLAIM